MSRWAPRARSPRAGAAHRGGRPDPRQRDFRRRHQGDAVGSWRPGMCCWSRADYALRPRRQLKALVERGIDGVMLVGADHNSEAYRLVAATACRRSSRGPSTGRVPCIGFDNRGAASRLCRHLLELGHERIAMIAGLKRATTAPARASTACATRCGAAAATCCRNCCANGPTPSPTAAPHCASSFPAGAADGGGVRQRSAFGALFEAAALGLRVPTTCRSPDSTISTSRPRWCRR